MEDYAKGIIGTKSEGSSRQSSFSIARPRRIFPRPEETINVVANMDKNTDTSYGEAAIDDDTKRYSIDTSIKSASTKNVLLSQVIRFETSLGMI